MNVLIPHVSYDQGSYGFGIIFSMTQCWGVSIYLIKGMLHLGIGIKSEERIQREKELSQMFAEAVKKGKK